MNKMTYEEKINRAKYYNGMVDADKLDSIRDVCDFYDAQIDARAKTMDELLQIYDFGGVIEQGVDNLNNKVMTAYEKKYGMLRGWKTFADLVSFFIATGGVIKE